MERERVSVLEACHAAAEAVGSDGIEWSAHRSGDGWVLAELGAGPGGRRVHVRGDGTCEILADDREPQPA